MRRTPHTFFAVALTCSVVGLVGCSSSASKSTTDVDAATPDGSFCSLYVAFRTSNDSLADEVNSGDADRAKAAVTRLVGQTELLRKKAPADIKADVDAVSVYVTSFDKLFAEYQYDVDALDGDEEAANKFRNLTSNQFDSSLLQLRTYADTECVAAGTTTTVVGNITIDNSTTTVAP